MVFTVARDSTSGAMSSYADQDAVPIRLSHCATTTTTQNTPQPKISESTSELLSRLGIQHTHPKSKAKLIEKSQEASRNREEAARRCERENAQQEKKRLREQKREQRRVLKEVQEARERAQKAKEAAEAKQERRREKKRSTKAPKGDRRFRGDDDHHAEPDHVSFPGYSAEEIDEQWRAFETQWAGFFDRRSSPPLSSANAIPWPEHALLAQYLKNSVRAADAAQRKRQLVMTFHPDKVKQKLTSHLTPDALSAACTITSELCKRILAAWE